MLIDLHLHSTKSRPNGDSIKWIGNKKVLNLLVNSRYKAISFTDHSIFDYIQYKEMKDYLNGYITIFPGIEINIRTVRGEIGNILYIFREDLDDNQLKELELISKKFLRKEGISCEHLTTAFNQFETIIIPHVGKSDYLEYEDLKKIKYDAIEVTNLSNRNYKKTIKKLNKPVSVVAFSDTHIWTSFPQQGKLVTDIIFDKDFITFDNLKNAFKENKNFTKEQYDQKY